MTENELGEQADSNNLPESKNIDLDILRQSAKSISRKYEEIAQEQNPLKDYNFKKNMKRN